jgi:hypothetical protein
MSLEQPQGEVGLNLSLGEKKRRHHYVWQHYLRAWAEDEQIPCWRAGRVFRTNTANVALVKDFYRLKELTPEDLHFVEMTCIRDAPEAVQPLLRGWIPAFSAVFELRRALESAGLNLQEGGSAELFDIAINNIEEDLHSTIEIGAIQHLNALRAGDMAFLSSDEELPTFLHYLCTQYMRTRKRRDAVLATLGDFPGANVENAWGLMSHILATTLAFSLNAQSDSIRFTLLQSPPNTEFVTSDQPVINLDAADLPSGVEPQSLTLYYPVSPTSALLMQMGQEQKEVVTRQTAADEVLDYNGVMFRQLHEQAFGNEQELIRLSPQ